MNKKGRRRPQGDDPNLPARPVAADLHIHTTHSDGGCSPGEVVRAAANVGLSALAITDHDTVSAIEVARPEASRLGVELIAGVELTAEREGREIHLLGHFVDDTNQALVETCRAMRLARRERLIRMVEGLKGQGLAIDLETIERTFPRATIGRRHLADWLVRSGQVGSGREAFSRYLGDDGPVQVAKPRLPWREAIRLVVEAGGVAGLAHPPYDLRSNQLRELVDGGLRAIEVAGPGVNSRCGVRWRAWADEFQIASIAGSDFHSGDRPGRWVGSITTPEADLNRLRALRPSPVLAGS